MALPDDTLDGFSPNDQQLKILSKELKRKSTTLVSLTRSMMTNPHLADDASALKAYAEAIIALHAPSQEAKEILC